MYRLHCSGEAEFSLLAAAAAAVGWGPGEVLEVEGGGGVKAERRGQ